MFKSKSIPSSFSYFPEKVKKKKKGLYCKLDLDFAE
jgi:hypothetical protein